MEPRLPLRSLCAWLHLSDLHFGHPSVAHGVDRKLVFEPLLGDLERWGKQGRPKPTHVIVTGDVAFGAKPAEFAEAQRWFAGLGQKLGIAPERFYFVPGNHDGVRGSAKKEVALYRLLDAIRKQQPTLEEALAARTKKDDDGKLLEARFKDFRAFAKRHAKVEWSGWTSWQARLEGEGGLALRLVGLNSAILIHEKRSKRALRIDKEQQLLLARSRKPGEIVVGLCHHPIRSDWLDKANAEEVKGRIEACCDLFLSGHEHHARFEQVSANGRKLVWIGAGALHEDERKNKAERYEHAYNVTEISADADQQLWARVWPRRWTDETKGFGVDPNIHSDGVEHSQAFALGAQIGTQRTGASSSPTRSNRPQAVAGRPLWIVGVALEFGMHMQAIEARVRGLAGLSEIRVIDAAQPAGARIPKDGLAIVLIGGRTGPGTFLVDAARASAERIVLVQPNPHLDPKHWEELLSCLKVRAALGSRPDFGTPETAAERAVEALAAQLRAHLAASPDRPVLEIFEQKWIEMRFGTWERGSLGPLKAHADPKLDLKHAALYVPLRAKPELCWLDKDGKLQVEAKVGGSQKKARKAIEDFSSELSRDQAPRAPHLERALCHPELPHLVIEGEPGAGKTVLLEHVAFALGCLHLLQPPPPHDLELAELGGGRAFQRIPLLVLASNLAAELESAEGLTGLEAGLCRQIEATTKVAVDRDFFHAGLADGRYLLLIDSLDEVPNEVARSRLVQSLCGLARAHPACRFVLTTRPMAYVGRVHFDEPLRVIRAAELEDSEVTALITRFCAAHAFDEAFADGLKSAVKGLAERYGGADFASNPLLLTCVFTVYAPDRRLPDSAARLYDRVVTILCETRPGSFSAETRRQYLQFLFGLMQRRGGAKMPVPELADALSEKFPVFKNLERATNAIDQLHASTGLVRFEDGETADGHPVKLLRPWHRSFQEYLAACEIASSDKDVRLETRSLLESQDGRTAPCFDPDWTGVLRFLTATQASKTFGCARIYIETLHEEALKLGDDRGEKAQLFGLVASGLAEYEEFLAEHPLRATLPREIVAAFEKGGAAWPLRERLFALEGAGRLGDPRLAEPVWVEVEGGSFRMGGDKEAYQAAPAHELEVQAFKIAWRLVTVQDFDAFLKKVDREACWASGRDGKESIEPDLWRSQCMHPNRPVVGVSWYLAKAFCHWAQTAGHWSVPQGFEIDLPLEAEWEFAARGPEGRGYPWGQAEPGVGIDARANYWKIEETRAPSPVGAFPKGAVPSARADRRIEDMAGNVWEWCLDTWRDEDKPSEWRSSFGNWLGKLKSSPNRRVSPAVPRGLRGGSWSNDPGDLRAATRGRSHPGGRSRDLGFRVVCRPVREHVVP